MYSVILTTVSEGYYEQGEFVPSNEGKLEPMNKGIDMLMNLRDTDTCIMPYHGPNCTTTGYATIVAVITLDGVLPKDEVIEVIEYWQDIYTKLSVPVTVQQVSTSTLTIYHSRDADGFTDVLNYLKTCWR